MFLQLQHVVHKTPTQSKRHKAQLVTVEITNSNIFIITSNFIFFSCYWNRKWYDNVRRGTVHWSAVTSSLQSIVNAASAQALALTRYRVAGFKLASVQPIGLILLSAVHLEFPSCVSALKCIALDMGSSLNSTRKLLWETSESAIRNITFGRTEGRRVLLVVYQRDAHFKELLFLGFSLDTSTVYTMAE